MKNADIDSKRLFAAIILPADLRMQLFDSIKGLARQYPEIRPIAAENIHLTLKFLGSRGTFMVRKIAAAMRNTAQDFESFSFTAASIAGAFPDSSSARILFVPVEGGAGQVDNIFNILENNLLKVKIKKEEREFIPHITVARINDNLNITDLVKKITYNFKEPVNCSKISLLESRLKPSGAEYVILEEFALK